jgi:hypothetical protein
MSASDRGEVEILERALRGLTPQSAHVDRDRLMFAAGVASTQRARRTWQGLAAASSLIAAALAVALGLHPPTTCTETVIRDHYVYVPVAASPALTQPGSGGLVAVASHEPGPPAGDVHLMQLRGVVLRWGVDALPRPQLGPATAGPRTPPTSAYDRRELSQSEKF